MAEKRKYEDTEQNDDTDPVVSLQDIIDEDRELESTANAVLGGSDDQDCTYHEGYMKRQALYACSTCKTKDDAGVCLACSLDCHDGHELYELYTKRNFRCDCGNSKFPDFNCHFLPSKDFTNDKNEYNHNFRGLYCTCKRPYPDPEDSIDDEMIQCIVCEDWFHSRHLHGKGIPEGSDFAEMICHLCMGNQTPFLWFYNWEYTPYESAIMDISKSPNNTEDEIIIKHEHSINVTATTAECDKKSCNDLVQFTNSSNDNITLTKQPNNNVIQDVSVVQLKENAENTTTESSDICTNDGISHKSETYESNADVKGETDRNESSNSFPNTISCTDDSAIDHSKPDMVTVKIKSDEVHAKSESATEAIHKKVTDKMKCELEYLKDVYKTCNFPDSAAFWPDGWRTKLCKCEKCKILMSGLSYLTDIDDTVAEYEKKGELKQSDSTMDKGMQVLGGMNRVQQVEVIQGYNDMKSKLSEYLRTFAQEGRVVTEDDIKNFFQKMNESKKPRLGISHLCK